MEQQTVAEVTVEQYRKPTRREGVLDEQWVILSDPAVEESLYDSRAMRQFVGIDLGREPVLDETRSASFGISWKPTSWASSSLLGLGSI